MGVSSACESGIAPSQPSLSRFMAELTLAASMYSIRKNYASTSSSDGEDSDDTRDHEACRSLHARHAFPPPPPPRPPMPIGPAPLPASRTRRPRPPTAQAEAQTLAFKAYEPKRRRRLQPPYNLADAAPAPPDAQVNASPLFTTVTQPQTASNTRERASGRLAPVFQLHGHTKAVNCLRWSPLFPSLALSASMDGSARVWDVSLRSCRRVLRLHGASLGVRSARWSLDGCHVLSGGYDGRAVYSDVETGRTVRSYTFSTPSSTRVRPITATRSPVEAVTSVAVHPLDPFWIVAGSSRGRIQSFDLRSPSDRPAHSFSRAFAQVHDLLFLPLTTGEDSRLVSSADVTSRDASHQTLLVWDFRSSTLLFDRLGSDFQAFQSLRLHPTRPQFAAQSAAGHAALFSTSPPYKRIRRKQSATTGKFAGFSGGHQVAGYAIQCSFSADGELFATGDATGRLVLYSDKSGRVVQSVRLSDERTPVMCAEFSPQPLAGGLVLAAGDYAGRIHMMSVQ